MKIFSGIQPSGVLHLGNYLGAIKQWVKMQGESDQAIFCIVDMHAITVPQDKKELRENILKTAAVYLAAGIDPKKSTLFVQSTRSEHTELCWILNCVTSMGQLNRMTQYKDKADKNKEGTSVGLFDYPILMAADILLYGTTHVPVGEDQKQHVELARDIAQRFNKKYGEIFIIPKAIMADTSARIMGLDDPVKKMSKSADSSNNYIALDDSSDIIKEKIKRAVTDSDDKIVTEKNKLAITNLLNIFSEVKNVSVEELEKKYQGKGYAEFKDDLASAVIEFLMPFQEKYQAIRKDEKMLIDLLRQGSENIAPIAKKKLKEVKEVVGLGLNTH